VNATVGSEILTTEALAFVERLHRALNPRRLELLEQRHERQLDLDAGENPRFLPETREIRESEWCVSPAPADLTDRRCEITGPVERKMMLNALNSGARVFMADFADAKAGWLQGRRASRFPRRDPRGPRGILAGGTGAGRSVEPAGRDHRAGRAEDDDQRAQFRGAGLHG